MLADTPDDDLERQVDALYRQHRSAIFAYISHLSRDPQLAEEVTQETFVRVFAARDRLLEINNVRAWIFRVATNLYLNILRKNRRWQWLSWNDSNQEPKTPRNFAADIECQDAVEQTLSALDNVYRAPLLLFGYYGFSISDTATILGISEGAVKTRVYRAKKMFMQVYRRGEYDE